VVTGDFSVGDEVGNSIIIFIVTQYAK
jgi:hypothetical protein